MSRRSDFRARPATIGKARCAVRGCFHPNRVRPNDRWPAVKSIKGSILWIKWRAISAKSERSRKGGNVTSSVLRRNSKSDRNRPFAIEFVEIGIGGRHQENVDLTFGATDRPDSPIVQKAQQHGLQRHRHVADLVEEERSAVRFLEQSRRPALFCSVKAPSA